MGYAIEIIDLTKRYPARVNRSEEGFRGSLGISKVLDTLGNITKISKEKVHSFVEALSHVNLSIKKGEVCGLLGPNGSGKTTLIKILCTIVIHDEGKVYVNGFDVKKQPSKVLKNVQAVLPDSRGFDWRLTGRQNLEFYALLYGLGKQASRERIDYLFQMTGLAERSGDAYQRYSTGMQRKLLLCRALLRDTPCLLFDEPTSGLDPASAIEFRHLLRDQLARKEGKTILLSTHNLEEAQDVCDRVAILNLGRITTCDTLGNVKSTISDEKIITVTLAKTMSLTETSELMNELQKLSCVRAVVPESDTPDSFSRFSIHTERSVALSGILESLSKSSVMITAINTREPTLEDVFMAMTRRS